MVGTKRQWLGGAILIALTIAPMFAPLTLNNLVGLILWLVIFFAILFWFLSGFKWFRRLRSAPGARTWVTVLWVAIISAAIGFIIGPVFWAMLPHDDEVTGVAANSTNRVTSEKSDAASKLMLTMEMPMGVGYTSTQVVRKVEQGPGYSRWKAFLQRNITNRDNRGMSLSFRLLFRAKADDGTFRWSFMAGVFSETEDWKSGRTVVNIASNTTASGWLIFDVMPPEAVFLDTLDGRWSFGGMWVEITDLISGISVLGRANGYPPDLEFVDLETFQKRHSEGADAAAKARAEPKSPVEDKSSSPKENPQEKTAKKDAEPTKDTE